MLVNATHPSVDGCGKEKTAPSRSGRYLDKTQPDHTLSPAPDSASQNSDACLAVPKSGPVLGLLESEAEPGTRRHGQRTCNQADEDCGRSAPLGTWRVAELLFSENEEELMAFAAGLGAGRKQEEAWGWEDWGNGAREDGLFDLIIAADIIYLQSLWDAMAFTIKVIVSVCWLLLLQATNTSRPMVPTIFCVVGRFLACVCGQICFSRPLPQGLFLRLHTVHTFVLWLICLTCPSCIREVGSWVGPPTSLSKSANSEIATRWFLFRRFPLAWSPRMERREYCVLGSYVLCFSIVLETGVIETEREGLDEL